ncbi:MAG: rod shape-determining protein MreD [Gammaproteobacteria bacterium]|nr:rod shape-determining protein MreD [Gammaproteobacteria bacterium]
MSKSSYGGGVIITTLIIAALLTLLPLPDYVRVFRPEFVGLTLIYWALAVPQRVGISFAWSIGLLMDVMLGGALGLLAFTYSLLVYLVLQFHLQLRQYPMWQQALSVFSLILLLQILFVFASSHSAGWTFWMPAIMSMLIWPLVYHLLRGVRRTFHVH